MNFQLIRHLLATRLNVQRLNLKEVGFDGARSGRDCFQSECWKKRITQRKSVACGGGNSKIGEKKNAVKAFI